jgi:tetratricopeptide (TPR) repeat protein
LAENPKNKNLPTLNNYKLLQIGENLLEKGLYFISWQWAKILLIAIGNSQEVKIFLIKAGASYHQRIAIRECLFLIDNNSCKLSFPELALVNARILLHSNELEHMNEWLEMAEQSQDQPQDLLKEINYIKALELCLKNKNLSKAQALLESGISSDFYSNRENQDCSFLLGYVYIVRGEIKKGIGKMDILLKKSRSIFHIFFYLKALSAISGEETQKKKALTEIYKLTPTTLLDKKMLEEIYLIFGSSLKDHEVKHRVC